jgi:hypothetical protein
MGTAREIAKKRRIRRTSDSSAFAVGHRTIWEELKCTKKPKKRGNGPQMPPYDEASHGVFICRAETVRDKYSTRKVS